MAGRVLTHFRYGRFFGTIRRAFSKRRRLIRLVRNLYNQLGLEQIGCKICDNKNFTLLAESDRYGFDLQKQICNNCGLVQTYPSLSEEFHQKFYANLYRRLYTNSEKKVNYAKLVEEQRKKGKILIDYFKQRELPHELNKYTLVEIGCSSGGILAEISSSFSDVIGCDLDEDGIRYAQQHLNLKVECAALPTGNLPTPKIILMSHVLEHLYDPLAALKEIHSLMGKDDLLCIFVPGLNFVAKGAYKNDLRRYFHIAHVTDFTQGTLTNLAGSAGFVPLHIDQEINSIFQPVELGSVAWKRFDDDSVSNILRIDSTYRRII